MSYNTHERMFWGGARQYIGRICHVERGVL